MRTLLICLGAALSLFLAQTRNSFSQTEYLVMVDPQYGTFQRIDSLPGVHWITVMPSYTAFDEIHHQFIFKGSDTAMNNYLYTLDASNAAIIHQPTFPVLSDPSDNVIELMYDNSDGILYGLHWDNSEQREYFVRINQINGTFSIIDSIPDVHYIAIGPSFTTFDRVHHRYIFKGTPDNGPSRLYTIDALTGQVLYNPAFPQPPDDIVELQYSNTNNTLYGIHRDYALNAYFLVSFDQITGSFTNVCPLPVLMGIVENPHYTTFDEIHQRYIFYAIDASGMHRLYSINVNTGAVVNSPVFPMVTLPENVIELQFDNTAGILYALHWGLNKIVGLPDHNQPGFRVFPNPLYSGGVAELNREYKNILMRMYDASGAKVREVKVVDAKSLAFDCEGLTPGMYFVEVLADQYLFPVQKVMLGTP